MLYIGVVAPLTGEYASNGEEMLRGIKLYIEQMNKSGELHGKRIELTTKDDQNDPQDAKHIAHDLSLNNKVLLVLGHYSSAACGAAGNQYKKFGLPAITASATAETITDENSWYFRSNVSSSLQTELLATYLNKILHKKKVLLIADKGNLWAESVYSSFKNACEDLSFPISKHEEWYFDSRKNATEVEERLDDIINDIWTDWKE
ncbi:MAG: ABC transporter substrate-binding protein [Candidatus Electrothrix sp. YB6]